MNHVTQDEMRVGVPFALIRNPKISANAKTMYAAIGTHLPNPFPSINMLATYMGASRSTAERAIRELVESGWVTVAHRADERGHRASSLYTLHSKPKRHR